MRSFLINLAVLLVLASGPIFLLTVGVGLNLILQTYGYVPFFIGAASVGVFAVGLAYLRDTDRQRPES